MLAATPVWHVEGAPTSEQNTNVSSIIGGVVGGVSAICLLVLGALYLRRRERGLKSDSGDQDVGTRGQNRNPTPVELCPGGAKISELQASACLDSPGEASAAADFGCTENLFCSSVPTQVSRSSPISELPGSNGEEATHKPASQAHNVIDGHGNTELAPC